MRSSLVELRPEQSHVVQRLAPGQPDAGPRVPGSQDLHQTDDRQVFQDARRVPLCGLRYATTINNGTLGADRDLKTIG